MLKKNGVREGSGEQSALRKPLRVQLLVCSLCQHLYLRVPQENLEMFSHSCERSLFLGGKFTVHRQTLLVNDDNVDGRKTFRR